MTATAQAGARAGGMTGRRVARSVGRWALPAFTALAIGYLLIPAGVVSGLIRL